ncbi:MAG: acetylglutamate kinase [Prolixibacteraceae bacterium]|nr:acetylglutamate kinase [Prolixibacteraceae bacterium]
MDKLTLVKVGGKIVEEPESMNRLLKDFKSISGYKVLIHGGGRRATLVAEQLGVENQMIEGRRITSREMLDVVTMVYGGLVNKNIVAGLQALGCNAAGFTGADLDIIRAVKRPVKDIDYGYAGDVVDVNTRELRLLINEGVTPVIAPLTHDGKGMLLNTNADTIASEMAIALSEHYNVRLVYCFEKDGVLSNPDDDDSVIPELSRELYREYKTSGAIAAGMVPKLDNAYNALHNGVAEVLVTNAANLTRPGSKGTRVAL